MSVEILRELQQLRRRIEALERQEQWPNLLLGSANQYTISSGAITLSSPYHHYITIETQGGAASDDLDTISGGAIGQLLVIRAVDSDHTVVVKDGTDNIQCAGDFSMDTTRDAMLLINRGDLWIELSRSDNS